MVLAKEKKAATQLGVIVGAFILCWMPYFTLFMVTAYYGDMVNDALFTTAIWFGYFNSALNPILYPFCNANFKRAFKRMLGFSSGTPKAVGEVFSSPISHLNLRCAVPFHLNLIFNPQFEVFQMGNFN